MKRRIPAALVCALAMGLIAFSAAPAAPPCGCAQSPVVPQSPDYPSMYKNYLRTLLDGKYAEGWNCTAAGSRRTIARLIASGTLGRYTEEQILESLETDSNRMRSGFFEYFVRAAALRDFLDAGTFVLRSAGPDGAVVAITLGQERRDFGIVREHGVFKFDFFSDLLR